MKEEIWKSAFGFEGLYEVSSLGSMRAVEKMAYHNHSKSLIKRKQRILKLLSTDTSGYIGVTLTDKNGQTKRYLLHRIIAMTFIQNDLSKPCVNHKNGIKTDNRVENLEWVTYSENQKHAFAIGLQCNKGESHPRNKLTNSDVLKIRKMHNRETMGCNKLSALFSVDRSTVKDIINRKTWSHI